MIRVAPHKKLNIVRPIRFAEKDITRARLLKIDINLVARKSLKRAISRVANAKDDTR